MALVCGFVFFREGFANEKGSSPLPLDTSPSSHISVGWFVSLGSHFGFQLKEWGEAGTAPFLGDFFFI